MAYFQTPPLSIIDHPADANHKGGVRLGYHWIFLHSTVGTNSLDWLSTDPNSAVSCHRLIAKDGTIYKIVPDNEVAWTQGPAQIGNLPRRDPKTGKIVEDVNQWSLSIELENLNDGRDPYPYAQIKSCVDQVVEWKAAYGDLAVVAHAWCQSNKTDPRGFPWGQFFGMYYARMGTLL